MGIKRRSNAQAPNSSGTHSLLSSSVCFHHRLHVFLLFGADLSVTALQRHSQACRKHYSVCSGLRGRPHFFRRFYVDWKFWICLRGDKSSDVSLKPHQDNSTKFLLSLPEPHWLLIYFYDLLKVETAASMRHTPPRQVHSGKYLNNEMLGQKWNTKPGSRSIRVSAESQQLPGEHDNSQSERKPEKQLGFRRSSSVISSSRLLQIIPRSSELTGTKPRANGRTTNTAFGLIAAVMVMRSRNTLHTWGWPQEPSLTHRHTHAHTIWFTASETRHETCRKLTF